MKRGREGGIEGGGIDGDGGGDKSHGQTKCYTY